MNGFNQAPAWPTVGWRAILSKYLHILRVSLIERITYRGDFFLGTVLRFLPLLTTILLWQAIYAGSGNKNKILGGFSFNDMISYLLLVHVSRMFSSMPGLANGIARDIRDGSLKKYLLQPIDMIAYLMTYRIAHKAAYIATAFLPYALMFYLCGYFFPDWRFHWPDFWTLSAYVAALLLSFLLGFFFESCIGMVGFWFLEVTSLLYVVNTVNFFVSGHMFPLDLLPEPWGRILKMLPFQYLAYFPAAVFLGKVEKADLMWALGVEAFWVVFFFVLARWSYRLGLRRYGAYGG